VTAASDDRAYRVALHRIYRLGSMRFGVLERAFGSMRQAWEADHAALCAAGLDARTASEVVRARADIDPEAEAARLERAGIVALAPHDPGYPSKLAEIPDAPPVLYVRGQWLPEDEWSVAVVGTRRATAYGRQAAGELTRGLAANRVTVVSGLARGIDTIAHRAALDAGGRSVAVLANGLDTIYPPENARLADEIAEHGALVTELSPGDKAACRLLPAP
jgi:DNA processing protein